MAAPEQSTINTKSETVANVCIDYVLRGFVLSPDSTESVQIIEDSDGRPVHMIINKPEDRIYGETLDRISRRLNSQNQQAL